MSLNNKLNDLSEAQFESLSNRLTQQLSCLGLEAHPFKVLFT